MYSTFGINMNVENVYKLAAPFLSNIEVVKMEDLKPSYLKFLKKYHPDFPISAEAEIVIDDLERAQSFSLAFSESVLDDLHQEKMIGSFCEGSEFQKKVKIVRDSILELRQINPGLYELFNLVVHAVVICDSNKNAEGSKAYGGTTNRCIGLIWLNLRTDISRQNLLEMLIHELTHTLVFLDELNTGHFDYLTIPKKHYWATSSILKKNRPMDKVVHSILVSLELLHARNTYLAVENDKDLYHPNSSSLISNTNASIESVLSHPLLKEVCKPRAIELVKIAKMQIKKFEDLDNG